MWEFFENLSRIIKVLLKSDKNNGYFTQGVPKTCIPFFKCAYIFWHPRYICVCVCVYIYWARYDYIYNHDYIWLYDSCGSPMFRSGMTGLIIIIYDYIHNHISLNSSLNEKYLRKTLWRTWTHTFDVHYLFFYLENLFFYEIMWKSIVEQGRAQMTIWRMRISCRAPKATNTHSEYVILFFFTATVAARTRRNITLNVHCLYRQF
jgi:hypothetical protein